MTNFFRKSAALVGIAALLLAPFPAAAQGDGATLAVESSAAGSVLTTDQGPAGPALWRVSDDDTTIYLFGTVHALPGGIPWLDGKIAAALDTADEFVTEIDMSEDQAMQAGFMSRGILPAGKTLRGMLGDEDRKAFEASMVSLGLPPVAFDRFEPWYAALMVSMLPLLQQGYSPDSGVELVLAKRLRPDAKREALETIGYQLDLFDQMPIDMQVAYLRQAMEAAPTAVEMLDAMVAKWLEGDADALAELIGEQGADPAMLERILYARNRNWAEWIDARMDRPGTVFVAVGAGHLAGAGSLQDALAKEGIASIRVQ